MEIKLKKSIKVLLIISSVITLLNGYDINSKSIIYNTEYSHLTNNYAPWKSNSIQTILKSDHKDVIGIKGESLERYKQKDKRIELFYSTPFLDNFTWQIDYNFAENGVIVPKDTLHNKISYNVKDLFGISYGLKNSSYKNDTKSQTQDVELEKYYNNFRFAFTKSFTDVENAGDSTGNKISTHYFYDDNYTAIALSSGKELESLGNNSILISNVKSISLYGEYQIVKNWAVGYSSEYVKQDDLYIRKSISLAAIYKF